MNTTKEVPAVPERLEELVEELRDADRTERIELLIDWARDLPPLPERLEAHKDASHRVEECQSPVYLFAEMEGENARLFADAPVEAPTVRGFVSLLLAGLDGLPASEVLAVPNNLVERAGMAEILGMQRVHGLHAVLRRLKGMVARAAAAHAESRGDGR